MSQKRIRRVYVENGDLMVASCYLDETSPQRFNPDLVGHPTLNNSISLLAKQINTMLEEAELRGVRLGAERGAKECLRLCFEAIRDLGESR